MSHIDNAKLLERLSKHEYKKVQAVFDAMRKEIESGTFDLIPTDKEVEGLTGEDLPKIRMKLRDNNHVAASEIYALVNAVGTLWSELYEKEAEVERLDVKYVETLVKLNQAMEALEKVTNVTSNSEAYTDGARAHFIAHTALKSIKGANPYVETTPS